MRKHREMRARRIVENHKLKVCRNIWAKSAEEIERERNFFMSRNTKTGSIAEDHFVLLSTRLVYTHKMLYLGDYL